MFMTPSLLTSARFLGQEMGLLSVSVGQDSIVLAGVATSETGLFDYAWALRETGRFSSVLIQTIAVGDEISFVITLKG